jgi:cytoskeletal protein RodZ
LSLLGWAMTRVWAVGCMVLLAATLLSAQSGKTESEPATEPATKPPTSHSHASTSSRSKSSTHSTASKSKKSRKSSSKRTRGQQKIDAQRTLEIQEALIREHYLTGKASGVWNDATQQAMQRYQADNNWQSKTTPDARALIKLGLGPDHQHLLNPESAMTTQPQGTHDASISSQPGTAGPGKHQR